MNSVRQKEAAVQVSERTQKHHEARDCDENRKSYLQWILSEDSSFVYPLEIYEGNVWVQSR